MYKLIINQENFNGPKYLYSEDLEKFIPNKIRMTTLPTLYLGLVTTNSDVLIITLNTIIKSNYLICSI
ncbi:hypothetical protein [Acanthamoeba castellanii mimivirus]|uniref:Uncharacterized protein n=1 Tax=Acanthamoeba castellanii mimivirus TaxID=1899318 RepID=A0A1E1ES52_9VIRU|nr:hypothetical protein m4_igs_18 [Acanthamoeba polyphaga mimivirus]UTE96750.1 hypothetical protein m4_igs_862 [Acanthamoeba polyphaga mimivirus]BAV61082.1 hypothetical protein [Acanthamoeba castellanii mimivirus]BAV62070.1 hypothetical protein [Acanthamoeba castellanii mimivirus]